MTIETELPAVKASIPAAEEITADWGERCPDFEPGCFCCQMWAMHDEISRLQRENEHFTNSGIIEVAVRNSSVSDYINHWEGRALAAEAKLSALTLKDDPGNGGEAEPVTQEELSHFIRDKAESHKGMLQPDFWPFLAMYLMEEFSIRRGGNNVDKPR